MSPLTAATGIQLRIGVPLSLTALTVVGAMQAGADALVTVALVAVVLAVSALAAWRQLVGWPLLRALALTATAVTVACYGNPRNLGWFGLCVVAGWAAFGAPSRPAVALSAALAAVFGVQLLLVSREPGWVTWTAGIVFTTGACIFARRQRDVVEQLHAAQSELAERTRADERQRIAGEMHDLVGHTLTVSLLHIGSARLALDDDLERARASLTEAERAARRSLDDVRAAVALMRTSTSPSLLPVPTASGVATLVESFRRAGTRVDLEVRGSLNRISPSQGLAAYRIVQESLTNAARHGDGSPITVHVDAWPDRMTIVVRSGGASADLPSIGTGLGAMRERTEAVGGELVAGPVDGGWRVQAVLPS